jgi:hypothetical protein
MSQIIDHIGEISGTFLDKNTVRMMLKRDGRVTPCKGIPMEEKRLEVTQEQLMEHLRQ